MTKPIKMWAIKAPWRREIATRFSVGRTRQKTISEFEKYFSGTSWTWPRLYRRGYRCVRVEVREIEG